MRVAILFLVLALAITALAQVGPDQPYMLVFRGPVCPSPFTYSGSTIVSGNGTFTSCPEETLIEYFPSLEEAIKRLNNRTMWFNSGGQYSTTEPELKASNIIGLFKVQRIPVAIVPTNKKAKVIRQVPQEFEEPVLEWAVQP